MNYRNLSYFQVLAESININQASSKLLVSAQFLSKYIKELEDYYQVQLFYKTPRLSLTYEGELLLDFAKNVQLHESNFISELQDLNIAASTEIYLGIIGETIKQKLPNIIVDFKRVYENVKINVFEDSENSLFKKLSSGKLDIILGPELTTNDLIESFPISSERIFLLISDKLLRKKFPNDYPICADRFRFGFPSKHIQDLPFLRNNTENKLYLKFESQFKLTYCFSSSCTDALVDLCKKGLGAMFCTDIYLKSLNNSSSYDDNYLYAFPINDLDMEYHLDIAYSKNRHLSRLLTTFIKIAQSEYNIMEKK